MFTCLVTSVFNSGILPGVIIDDDFKKLDDMAKQVGRMMSSAEAAFPVAEWADSFSQ